MIRSNRPHVVSFLQFALSFEDTRLILLPIQHKFVHCYVDSDDYVTSDFTLSDKRDREEV